MQRSESIQLLCIYINANPQDSADHEGGVWQMPPSWGGKKPELENIGESDRMTLLFRKR